jgi:hypothetical protein
MIMAQDILTKTNNHFPKVDEFIKDELLQKGSLQLKFLEQGIKVKIKESAVWWYLSPDVLSKEQFIKEFKLRGFDIIHEPSKTSYDDEGFYYISIPVPTS